MRRVVIIYDVPEYDYDEDIISRPEEFTDFAQNVTVVHNLHGKVKSLSLRHNLEVVNGLKTYKGKVSINVEPKNGRDQTDASSS
jgi:hypothetical protein